MNKTRQSVLLAITLGVCAVGVGQEPNKTDANSPKTNISKKEQPDPKQTQDCLKRIKRFGDDFNAFLNLEVPAQEEQHARATDPESQFYLDSLRGQFNNSVAILRTDAAAISEDCNGQRGSPKPKK